VALFLSILGLCIAPILVVAFGRNQKWDAFFDGYVLVAMVGLVGWEMLPHAIGQGGIAAAVAIALGMIFPNWLERKTRGGHGSVAWLAFAGLLFHALLDGGALGHIGAHEHHGHMHGHGHGGRLEWAVILHRLPVGLMVFAMVEQVRGRAAAFGAIVALSLATVLGFYGGGAVTQLMSSDAALLFEAFVIGALLHVVFHDHASHSHTHEAEPDDSCCAATTCGDSAPVTSEPSHGHDHDEDSHSHGHDPEHDHDHDHGHGHDHAHDHAEDGHSHGGPAAGVEGLGALFGIATLAYFAFSGEASESQEVLLHLVLESAPALVFAYVAAGVLSATALESGIAWMGRGSRGAQAARGMAFGLPMPVCSCGVLPLYESLAKKGAPPTAAIAFLVATPELGVDAVLLSIPLLGTELAFARVAAAIVVAVVAALIVGRMVTVKPNRAETKQERDPIATRLREGLQYGLGELVDHTLPWIILGIAVAAIIEPLITPTAFAGMSSWAQVPLFAIFGIPLYICASGATPFAAVLIFSGVSPGAALAFLLTGPATNVTTFGVLQKLHCRKVAVVFGVVVTVTAILSGWGVDAVLTDIEVALNPHDHAAAPLYQVVSVIALAALFLSSLFRQGPRGMLHQVFKPHQ
jgi:uncharacterized membrane protein YraQ (UPF0718 family)